LLAPQWPIAKLAAIVHRLAHPHPPLVVDVHARRIDEHRFGGPEGDFQAFGDFEGLECLFGGELCRGGGGECQRNSGTQGKSRLHRSSSSERGKAGWSKAAGEWDAKESADSSRRAALDPGMPRHWRLGKVCGIHPDVVSPPVVVQHTAMCVKMLLEGSAVH